MEIKNYSDALNVEGDSHVAEKLFLVLYRVLALAEMKAPAAARGAFIPAGNAFDAVAAIGKVFSGAKSEVFVVDPYMDEKALTDFCILISERVPIKLLADEKDVKPSLAPVAARWAKQHADTRPLEVRFSPQRSLHDRLIVIDQLQVWSLTQSLNAFAARSPASILRVDAETATLKIAAYEQFWKSATPIV